MVNPQHLASRDLALTKRLSETVAVYMRWHSVEGHTAQTIRDYNNGLCPFVAALNGAGKTQLSDVTAFDILTHLEAMKARGCKPRTLRTRFQCIRSFLAWCVEWELLPSNPAAKVKPPKVPKTRKPFLARDAFEQLLGLCPINTFLGARRQAMLWLLRTTGIRHQELHSLLIEDLDWTGHTVRIRLGKGQKERRVPFHREAERAMLRYLSFRQDRHPVLWVTEERVPLTYWGIGQDLERLMSRAGLDVVDPCHVFRRTWAAGAVEQHIPRPYIQAVGGWSSPQMIDLYTQAMQEEKGAVEAFREFDPL